MNTLTWFRPRLFFYICLAATIALFSYLANLSDGASAPPSTRTGAGAQPAASAAATPDDPYEALLTELGAESAECKTLSDKLQTLRNEREQFLTSPSNGAAAGAPRDRLARFQQLSNAISDAAAELLACHDRHDPAEAPPLPEAPPPVDARGRPIDPEKLREPYIPPVPVPPAIQVPSAPAIETACIDFLADAAQGAEFANQLTEDLRELFQRRREVATRFLLGDERERYFLSEQIEALNQRITETTNGLLSASQHRAETGREVASHP
jgi:hypothetical protein